MYILTNRLKRGLCGLVLGSSLIFAGCATTGPRDVKGVNPEQDAKDAAGKTAQDNKTSVEYINVVGAGDRVLIGTTSSVKYTVFKLSDPARLIVDMPKVDIGKVPPSIKVDNDFIKEITASTYGADNEMGRIVITLRDGVDHEVKSGENSILVSLKKEGSPEVSDSAKASPENQAQTANDAPAAAPAAAAPAAADTAPVDKPAEASTNAAAPTDAAKAEPSADVKQATRILKIESAKDGKNSVIIIQTDGAIGNYNSFGLDSPSRIVMDIWGVDNGLGKDVLKIKDKYVKAVRVGNYHDKTRLVFDIGRKMPPHAIKKSGNNIILTMGAGVTESKATSNGVDTRVASLANVGIPNAVKASNDAPASAPAAPAEAPAKEVPAPAVKSDSVVVEGVDFRKIDDTGRLTIRGSAKLDYSVKDSEDGKSVIFDIKNATIPAELERTLDATKLNTDVVAISSFQQSTGPVKDVRVLVKLKDKAAYSVNASEATIDVDFKSNAAAVDKEAEKEAKSVTAEGVAKKEFTGKKIDLDMTDANITDVLRLLAEVSNLNIVASDDVKGTITLRLKNVPWDQAFDIILKSKNLDMIKKGNVIMVGPADKIKQQKEAALTAKKTQEKLEDLEIVFIPVSYANVSELMPQVKGVLTDRGSVTSDARTNTLIVKDVKSGRDASYALVKKLDTAIPQVLIEARIVEAATSYLRDLGIQWGVDFQTSGKTTTNTFGSTTQPGQAPPGATSGSVLGTGGTPTGTTPLVPFSGSPALTAMHGVQDFAVNLPATNTLGALGFILGNAGTNPAVLDLRISAGEQEGHLKTISRPRIATMDNKEAKIEQGESIPFQTTSAAGTATTFIDANLSLTVTPHITPDGSILMKIKANHNAIGTFKTSTGEPSIAKKEASTEVLVRDGETTVLGGIIVTDKNETYNGIPLLKDIPIIGWLFKNSEVTNNQQELLIFITPTILHEKSVS